MLFFGHVGITAGVAGLVKRNRIDYRTIMIGSVLPDIIDKPVFLILGRAIALSGRDYAHTLLFCLALAIAGLAARGKARPILVLLSLGSLAHLALDSIWNNPTTVLWPFLGPLKQGEVGDWMPNILQELSNPAVFIPEIIGLIILGYLLARVLRNRGFRLFMRKGEID